MYLLNMSEFRSLGYPGNADTKKEEAHYSKICVSSYF